MYRSVKTRRSLFTAEKTAQLRRNIEKFDWAKEKAAAILEKAEHYLAFGTDRIAGDVASHVLKRSTTVSQYAGCPHCGEEMLRHGKWIVDVIKHPWKVQCPNCGRHYPSNDFEAFYRSGQDAHGDFSYDRADRSLLVNTLYPDEAPDFAVDDGSGWIRDPDDPEHTMFAFIPCYILRSMWLQNAEKVSENEFVNAIRSLANAYLITGERKYGEPAAMLLSKMAALYPRMNALDCPWEMGYRLSHGLSGLGRMLGRIWDTLLLSEAAEWYDILFDCIDDAFAAYLRAHPIRYYGDAPESGAAVLADIEEQMFLQIYPDMKAYVLHCNPGPPQALLLKTARVLQRDDLFDEYAEFVYRYVDPNEPRGHTRDIETLLTELVTRDGFAGEAAPGYNGMWASGFMEAAALLKGHKYDLFQNVKFRKLGEMARGYIVSDAYTLNIGDSNMTGNPALRVTVDTQIQYFLATGNPADAQLLAKVAGDGPICTDWLTDCEAIDRSIRETAAKAGPYRSESRCLPGFGLAVCQSHPDGKEPESTAVYFGQNTGHGHYDTLHLSVHGFGIDLMPDLGYPDFTGANPARYRWSSNLLSHNTAMLPQDAPFAADAALGDEVFYQHNHSPISGGQIRHYLAGERVSLIDAEAPKLYGEPFRRTVVTVDLDGASRYIVDLFEVGGKNQRLSYHAMGTETAVTGAAFLPQDGGSYAGADVPYEDDAYSRRWCDGFNYLKDVKRAAKPAAGFTVDWTCVDNWHVWDRARQVHLKLHMLSAVDEAALCIGQPPKTRPGNPKELTYLILKNEAGTARFASVLEPYEDAPFLARCDVRADGDTTVVTVVHTSGRVDTVTVVRDSVDCRLDVQSTSGYAMTYGETVLTGTVVDFTRTLSAENAVTVRLDGDIDAASLRGRFVDIETDVEPNAFYEITNAEALGGLWRLSVGDCTFVKGFLDRRHKEQGYTYFAQEGAGVRITL